MNSVSAHAGEIILASASPRRRELLEQIGVKFSVAPAAIDESWNAGEAPGAYVERMACEKAHAGALHAGSGNHVIIGADTAVVIDSEVLGKPADRSHALAMLAKLSGRTHQVITGVAVTDGERLEHRLSLSKVRMRVIPAAEADAYWATGEPVDKAGAYAIQGLGGMFVAGLQGSYSGVVGLPVYETAELLAAFGYRVLQEAADHAGNSGE